MDERKSTTIKRQSGFPSSAADDGLILLQPVLDILSFWQDQAGADNTLTLALRFGMLLVVALAGFCLSGRKRIYVALAFVLLGFGLCHAAAVIQVDLQTLPGEREATGFGCC